MFSSKRLIVICDINTTQDKETGNRKKVVDNACKVVCNKDLVGIQTQQLAQSQNMVFQYTLELDRMFYNNQKYLYLEKGVYEIKNIAKGSKPHLCKLSVTALHDEDIKRAIEEYLQ